MGSCCRTLLGQSREASPLSEYETHWVHGVGKGKRVRLVDYMTASFGGVCVKLGKHNPRAFDGLAALCRPGALPELTEAQRIWCERAPMFDCNDPIRARVLTSLFYDVVVERHVEEVDMSRQGLCNLSVKRHRAMLGIVNDNDSLA